MPTTNIEIAARGRRITGLRRMLESLGAYAIVFTLRLDIEAMPREMVLEQWVGQDSRGHVVELRSLALEIYYVKDLCFVVKDDHPSIQGRWVWWLTDDVVDAVPEGHRDPTRRTP